MLLLEHVIFFIIWDLSSLLKRQQSEYFIFCFALALGLTYFSRDRGSIQFHDTELLMQEKFT